MDKRDPRVRHRFGVEIDGLLVGRFDAVAGISAEGEVVEFQEGGRNDALLKLPGQGRLGVLKLRRGYAGEPALWSWAKEPVPARRAVDVVLLDDDGTEASRYTLHRAWPVKWVAEDLDASGSAVFVESVELAYEGLTFSGGGGAKRPGGGGLAGRLAQLGSQVQGAQAARRAAEAARQAASGLAQNPASALQAAISVQVSIPGLPGLPSSPRPSASLPGAPGPSPGALNAEWAARAQGAVPTPPSEVGQAQAQVRSQMRAGEAIADQARDPAAAARAEALSQVPGPAAPLVNGQPPVPFQASASVGAQGVAHAGAPSTPSASGAPPWSDGAAPVQPAAAPRQPPMSSGSFSVGV